jgi:hypothetical protein
VHSSVWRESATALGWWWADPLVALGLAAVAVREGREALRGRTCCPSPLALDGDEHGHDPAGDDGCGCGGSCCGGD